MFSASEEIPKTRRNWNLISLFIFFIKVHEVHDLNIEPINLNDFFLLIKNDKIIDFRLRTAYFFYKADF